MRALCILGILASLGCTLPVRAEARQSLGVLGIIRVGAEESRSLVLFQIKSSQKTVLVPCQQLIPETSYRLLRVTRQGAVVQAAGIEEHLELEDRAPAPIVSGVESWIQGTGSEGEEPALVEAPTQQEIVWPKSLPLKVIEGKTAVEESTLETKE